MNGVYQDNAMKTMNWALTTGCTNLGGGCDSCPSFLEYQENGWDYSIVFHGAQLSVPQSIKAPTLFTVSLGSDLFHENVPEHFICDAFKVMNNTPQHTYEIVTKRPEYLVKMVPLLQWTDNIHIGTTVELEKHKWKIDYLRKVPSYNRYVTFIVLERIGKLNMEGIKTAGILTETWGLRRPARVDWVQEVELQCIAQGVELSNNAYIYEAV